MKTYPVNHLQAKAIVVRCPDRRFRIAHREFIKEELGLNGEDFWPLKPAGGVAALARSTQMPSRFAALIEDIELFVGHSPIHHIVLINHEDCRKYDSILDRRQSAPHPERDDLFSAVRLLSRKYPHIEISAYFARFTDESHTEIFFEAVIASTLQVTEPELVAV